MKIELKDIPPDGLALQGELSTVGYDLPVSEHKDWNRIEYDFFIELKGTECLIQGSLNTHYKTDCSRCLDPIDVCIEVPDFVHALEIEGKESIDLTQEIREDILLNLPLAPSCKLNQEFRCPFSGKVFRDTTSGFDVRTRESVWGALEKFKEKQ